MKSMMTLMYGGVEWRRDKVKVIVLVGHTHTRLKDHCLRAWSFGHAMCRGGDEAVPA